MHHKGFAKKVRNSTGIYQGEFLREVYEQGKEPSGPSFNLKERRSMKGGRGREPGRHFLEGKVRLNDLLTPGGAHFRARGERETKQTVGKTGNHKRIRGSARTYLQDRNLLQEDFGRKISTTCSYLKRNGKNVIRGRKTVGKRNSGRISERERRKAETRKKN